jgi:hypothetical protein
LSEHTAFIFSVISEDTSLATTLTIHPGLGVGNSGDGRDSSRTVDVVPLPTIADPKVLYLPFITKSSESQKAAQIAEVSVISRVSLYNCQLYKHLYYLVE